MSPATLTYAVLAERFRQQDQERERAALVSAMQSRQMRPELRRVFNHFADRTVAIVGSSLRDFDSARDIDVLFPADTDFRQLAKDLGAKYLGKFKGPLTGGDVRRLSTIAIEGVSKPIQCISDSSVTTFEQWPHTVLLRDGRVLNADQHYVKPLKEAA